MTQTYTAKGTASAKTSGTTLTVSSVACKAGDLLIAGVGYDISQGNPTVKFGKHELGTGEGHTLGTSWRVRQFRRRCRETRTYDVVATWGTAIAARVMTVCVLTEAGAQDVSSDNENLAGTVSTTGVNTVVGHRLTAHVHHHVTNGPSTDAAGVVVADDTLGQSDGTIGDADNTNLTINETYQVIAAPVVTVTTGFTIGNTYEIKTVGDTNWTSIGAASATVGVVFVATGVGSGTTGDAYEYVNMRGRITTLATRDHMAVGVAYKPRQTFTVKECLQYHRNMNNVPDDVWVLLEDEAGDGFWFPIDEGDFDGMLDAQFYDACVEAASIWAARILDGEDPLWTADATRDTRMAGYVDDEVVL